MAEILLVRHAESYANKRDFTAFGNKDSPLTPRGIEQAQALNETFRTEFGIVPAEYDRPVLTSAFTRAQQTAEFAGFRRIDTNPIINELDVDDVVMNGIDIIEKHRQERWVPESSELTVPGFIDQLQEGRLDYEIYFTHGMFIAALLLQCETRLIEVATPFDEKRGYVPLQTAIIKLDI